MPRKKIKLITLDLDDTLWPNKKVIVDAENAWLNFITIKFPNLKESFSEEHLAELRNRLIKSVVAFAICMILSFTIATPIFNFLANPIVDILKLNGQEPDLIF